MFALTIFPFIKDQAYVAPGWRGTDAVAVWPMPMKVGERMVVLGGSATVMFRNPVVRAPPESVTMHVKVVVPACPTPKVMEFVLVEADEMAPLEIIHK